MKRMFMIICAVIGTFAISLLSFAAVTYGGLPSTRSFYSPLDTVEEWDTVLSETHCQAYSFSWSGGSDYVIAPNCHYESHYYAPIHAFTRLESGKTYEFSYLNHDMKIVTTPTTVYFYSDGVEKAHTGWADSTHEEFYFLPWVCSVNGFYYIRFTVDTYDNYKVSLAPGFRELHYMWSLDVPGDYLLGDSIRYTDDGWTNTQLKFQGVEIPNVTTEAPNPTGEAPTPTLEAPSPTGEAPSTTSVSPPYDGWDDDKNTVTGAFDFLKNAGNGLSSFFSAVFSFLPAPVIGLIAAAVVLLIVIGLVKALL